MFADFLRVPGMLANQEAAAPQIVGFAGEAGFFVQLGQAVESRVAGFQFGGLLELGDGAVVLA